MTEWGGIHSDTHISGSDGFSMMILTEPTFDWRGESTVDFILRLMPDESNRPGAWKDVEQLVRTAIDTGGARDLPYQALKMYLCDTMSDTFGLSIDRKHGGGFYIAAKNRADLFKLALRFEEATHTKVWNSNMKFYVRVKKGDKFISDGNATTGHKRQFSQEGW